MMRPPCGSCVRMTRNASRVQRNTPVRFTSTTYCHSSSESSSIIRAGALDPGVVEQQIHPAVVGNGGVEQLAHGGLFRYIRDDRIERTGASPDRTEQRLEASPGEHDGPPVLGQRQRDGRTDAAASAGDHGNSRRL